MTWNESQQQVRSDTVSVEVDAGEDENDLESVTATGEIRHRAW